MRLLFCGTIPPLDESFFTIEPNDDSLMAATHSNVARPVFVHFLAVSLLLLNSSCSTAITVTSERHCRCGRQLSKHTAVCIGQSFRLCLRLPLRSTRVSLIKRMKSVHGVMMLVKPLHIWTGCLVNIIVDCHVVRMTLPPSVSIPDDRSRKHQSSGLCGEDFRARQASATSRWRDICGRGGRGMILIFMVLG